MSARRWATVLLAGTSYGILTGAVDEVAGGLDQTDLVRALGMALNAGAVWAGVAVLSGRTQRRPAPSAVAGVMGLCAAVAGYYGYGLAWGDRTDVGLASLAGALRFWLAAALVGGALLGVVGGQTRRAGAVGLAAALVVPLGVLAEMVLLRRLGPGSFDADPALAWAQSALVATALLGAAIAVYLKLLRGGRGARR